MRRARAPSRIATRESPRFARGSRSVASDGGFNRHRAAVCSLNSARYAAIQALASIRRAFQMEGIVFVWEEGRTVGIKL